MPVHPSELVAAAKDVRGRGGEDDFRTEQEGHPQVEAVVGFHLIVHQTGKNGIVPGTAAGVGVRQAENETQAGNGPPEDKGGIVTRGILRRSQFGILQIAAARKVVGIGKAVLHVLQRDTVEEEKVEARAVSVAVGGER